MSHETILEKLCRVCGRYIATKSVKTKYPCSKHQGSLSSVFDIDVRQDSPSIHPLYFCHACKNITQKASTWYEHKTEPFTEWCEHSDTSCKVCQHFSTLQKGGRPRKVGYATGRPSHNGPRYCAQNIQAIAPPAFVYTHHAPPQICERDQAVDVRQLECPICGNLLQSPVELVTCGNIVCANCCCSWLRHSKGTSCPCCYSCHLEDFTTVRQASALTVSLLASVCVICGACGSHMRQDTYSKHIDSGCKSNGASSPSSSPVDTSVENMLNRDITTPLTPIELKLQSRLAKRSLATSPDDNILKIKTGGQV